MTSLNRRTALMLGLAATASWTIPVRAQQGSPVKVALDWTPNTNHIGLFVARDKGFYAEAGLDVEILPYGDTSAGALISNGIADFGVTGALGFFTQKAAGADLKAVYAVVQTETGRLVFNADRSDIQSPKDLDGLTYGGFGSNWEKALITSLIRNDGGKGNFETVTLGTSAYEALANRAIDFTLEVYTWEGVKAELEGRPQRAFRYADFGVPDQHTTFLASSPDYLEANPKQASAFIQATRRGYAFAVDNQEEAAAILVNANKDMFTDPALVRASLKALVEGDYLARADGTVGEIDSAKFEAMGAFLFSAGILLDADGRPLAAEPTFSDWFTNEFFAAG
ncbi:ABC transporter substrate-binding protein [Tianweitania sediminis]|jgi:ABC-type nitrate/sulfonate/bicarbonate transport system substrate-binding protein|uniref:Thiamine pyrimidine synthase n=1 Tax=Tianweitania sediminis TaxID=1502156 RepID=A0A8J7UKD4_9HYPH|nr:ABC transporter substrate-binding protein [Tianweitania sediminis]MBP0438247.1 ABC transporter substrate-binding protein [Tianweitania sediminis]HEV7416527.1 ABC transporter substrate-binding protein [Tianweitania sediminis]